MDESGYVRYDNELKTYINITASLTYFYSTSNKNLKQNSRNFKKIRLCTKIDFEKVNYVSGFVEDEENNFDLCVDNYDGMVITNN